MENKICISFYLRESAIRLHQKTLDAIGSPAFVRLLISSDNETLAIIPCADKDLRSFKARQSQNSKTGRAEIHSQKLCRTLARLNGWEEHHSYRMWGKAYPAQGAAVFHFAGAKRITASNKQC